MLTTSFWGWLQRVRGRFGNDLAGSDLPATVIGLLIIAIVIAVLVFFSFNFPAGPVGEVTGVVEGSAFYQNDGRASKVIYVRLPSSDVVAVVTCTNTMLAAGQPARLLIYRRHLTDARTYKFAAAMQPHCSRYNAALAK